MTGFDQSSLVETMTPSVFMMVLRRMHERSGLTAGQIAVSSGLPRSTAYRFVHPQNHTLPKSRDQVLAFMQACRVPTQQVKTMLHIWDRLSGNGGPDDPDEASFKPASTISTGPPEVVPVPDSAEDRRQPLSQDQITSFTDVDMVQYFGRRWAQKTERQSLRVFLDLDDVECTCPARKEPVTLGIADLEAVAAAAPALLPSRVTPWQLRLVAMALLTLLIYPVAMLTTFTRYDTKIAVIPFLVIGIGLLLLLSGTFHRSPWTEVVTPARLLMVAVSSVGAAALAGLSTGTLVVGLLSGFSVCAMAPTWLTLTRLPGLFTTTRGVFTLIASGWFGTGLGCTATLVDVPATGAVLTGIAGTVTSIMLLSSRVLPLAGEENRTPKASAEAAESG